MATASSGSAAPTTTAEAPTAGFFLPDERRARKPPGTFPAAFSCAPPRFLKMGCIAGQPRAALLQHASLRSSPASRPGRIAQLVEQLTLNQRVPGSSPGAPTNQNKHLGWYRTEQSAHVLQCVLQFCSRFELHDRNLGEFSVAAEIMRVAAFSTWIKAGCRPVPGSVQKRHLDVKFCIYIESA